MRRLKTTSFRDSRMKRVSELELPDIIETRTESGQIVELPDDKFVQLSNFNVGRALARVIGDGETCRKSADKTIAMTYARRNRLAEARQFVDELSPLKCAKINPIGKERHSRPSRAARAGGLDDRQSLFRRLNVEARRRARDQDQVGNRYRCAECAIAWGGINDDKISRDFLNRPNPLGYAPARQRELIDWEIEVPRLGPLACRSLLVAVDKSDVDSAPSCFARKAYRDRRLAYAALALRYDKFCRPACVFLSNRRGSCQICRSTTSIGSPYCDLRRENVFYINPRAEKVNQPH